MPGSTFPGHAGKLCTAIRIQVADPVHDDRAFRPRRSLALAFEGLRRLRPEFPMRRDFPDEYEHGRLAVDLINGSDLLRQRRVHDPSAAPADLDAVAAPDERAWREKRKSVLIC